MYLIFFWTIVFSLSTAISIVLLGDRNLISGNLFEYKNIIRLMFNVKFFFAFLLALVARFSFILMNNYLLKIEKFAGNSTTITAFVSTAAFIFIALANYIFLHERLSLQQAVGSAIIMAGIWMMLK
jgi:drug/metabolite transporter (DMT)-like permease